MIKKHYTSSFTKRLKRLLHAKNIVVVSQHTVDHYSLSFKAQIAIMLTVIGVVGIASFSTGRYIEATKTIAEKDHTIEVTSAEKIKINNEYALLKRDLLRMTEQGESLSDYAQFVIEQYQRPQAEPVFDDSLLKAGDVASNGKLFERLQYLESEIERERFRKKQFIHTIRLLTNEKLNMLEKAIKMTGMEEEMSSLINDMREEANFAMLIEAETEQGGPFYPYDEGINNTLEEMEEKALNEVTYLVEMLDMMERMPLANPMPHARITSGFGRRLDPIRRRPANHTGMDFAGRVGTKVLATGKGVVKYAGYLGAYGRTVDIDHGDGFSTRYSHMSRILVNKGDRVALGQSVGIQGTTGRSTGHHLHYEVRYHNKPINPAKFVKAGQYVSKALN